MPINLGIRIKVVFHINPIAFPNRRIIFLGHVVDIGFKVFRHAIFHLRGTHGFGGGNHRFDHELDIDFAIFIGGGNDFGLLHIRHRGNKTRDIQGFLGDADGVAGKHIVLHSLDITSDPLGGRQNRGHANDANARSHNN